MPPTHKNDMRTEVRKNKLPFGIPWIPQGLSAALLAGTFVLGVGTGVTVDSAINTNPKVRPLVNSQCVTTVIKQRHLVQVYWMESHHHCCP